MRRLLLGIPILAVVLGAMAIGQVAQTAKAQAGETIVIRAGDGEPGYSVNAFLPGTLTVETGTTVTWKFPWPELHIIAGCVGQCPTDEPAGPISGDFPNAQGFFFSGEVIGDPANPPTFSVRFTEAGTYDYFCPIHPLMTAQVKVVDAGAPGSTSIEDQLSADTRGAAEFSSRLIAAKDAAANVLVPPAVAKGASNQTHTVIMGATTFQGDDANQFFAPAVNVKVGDSVIFKNDTFTPHDVAIGGPPQGDPFAVPYDKTSATYAGSGDLLTPMLGAGPGYGASQFEIVFSKAGTYDYYCALHAPQGMVGKVVVSEKTTPQPPLPPNTGTGVATGSDSLASWSFIIGIAALVAAVGGVSAVAVRRS